MHILVRYEYPLTTAETKELDFAEAVTYRYTYEKDSDKLVAYNGSTIYYNVVGAPTTYCGKILTWNLGRELASFGGTTFTYNARGQRVGKNNITYTYDADGKLIKTSNGMTFLYDHTGVFAFEYDGATYYYRKNAQNDIIAILDNTGEVVVEYKYDAWGNHKVLDVSGNEITNEASIGIINPFRYRSYFYDVETGLYYLNSRYYDPKLGRFISPDDISYLDPNTVNGLNLYAYCENNPVNNFDPSGNFKLPNWAKWVIGGVAFVGAVVLTAATGGALTPVFISMGVSIVSSGIIEGTVSAYNGDGFLNGFINGAADGAMWGGIFALGGATLRTVKIFKNGVAIGENMKRVNKLAKAGNQITYKGMPGFNIVKKFGGDNIARKMSISHNKRFIERMMRWGVKIVDFGIDTTRDYRSFYYLMETIVSTGYNALKIMY